MKINTSKFELFYLSRNPVQRFFQVGRSLEKQVEESYFGVAFICDGKQDENLDVRLGKASAVMRT